MSRRIVQITPAVYPGPGEAVNHGLLALCDDGTVWFHRLLAGSGYNAPRVAVSEDGPETKATFGQWRQIHVGEIPS